MVATIASLITYSETLRVPGRATDFGEIWFGARSLLAGLNPYLMIGPGRTFEWEWVSPYPITTFVAAVPFSFLPQLAASLVFVWLSAWAFAFFLTRIRWHRLYLVPSAAFIVAARSAQWSPLMSAIFLQPALGWLLPVKPNIGAAIGLAAPSRRTVVLGVIGGLVLTAIGFWLLPDWVGYWAANVRSTSHLVIPITRPGGFLVLLALFQWRDPSARLLVLLACVPQTGSWYESLPLLLVAESRRECQLLSMISSVGFIASAHLIQLHDVPQINRDVETFIVWFVFLPATFVLLQRGNARAQIASIFSSARGARSSF